MRITWDDENKCVYITQTAHIEAAVNKFKPMAEGNWNPRKWPMLDSLKLCRSGTNFDLESEDLDVVQCPYRSLIGSMNFVSTCSRPDITYALNQLAKYSNDPKVAHWNAAMDLLKHLDGTKYYGIVLGRTNVSLPEPFCSKLENYHADAQAFADANWATGIDDKRSTSGLLLHVYTGPVYWAAQGQPVTATASGESESRALSSMTKEVLYVQKLLPLFGISIMPFRINCDSKGALDSVTNYAYTKHSKHLEVHHDFMREKFQRAEIDFTLIPGEVNPADIFTKPLNAKFPGMRAAIGVAELPFKYR
jgi:hypothetical protein